MSIDTAALTDLYELTMLQAYVEENMHEEATFSLFVRALPHTRNMLIACGLDNVLAYLETVRFTPELVAQLKGINVFSDRFLQWLTTFRFEGSVRAVAEGTPVFGHEPLLEVTGPLPQAQVVESYVLNQVHFQTVVASKAIRLVQAAQGRPVVDFGMRRAHGSDAALKAARSSYIAGVSATSNVLAALTYGIPVTGTMAHSYIQAHDDERSAFAAFVNEFPESTLLVDTYDTLEGVRHVIALARLLGREFRVRAVRLDSGDLDMLSHQARQELDAAGLAHIRIIASGGLNEERIARLVRSQAPIDAFGVGTQLVVSDDAPSLDMAYKLVSYAGVDRFKTSAGKATLAGPKQILRTGEQGSAHGDVLVRADETWNEGRPLLGVVMERGRRTAAAAPSLSQLRQECAQAVHELPAAIRAIEPALPGYPVIISQRLRAHC